MLPLSVCENVCRRNYICGLNSHRVYTVCELERRGERQEGGVGCNTANLLVACSLVSNRENWS